jgi:hypothetical protein
MTLLNRQRSLVQDRGRLVLPGRENETNPRTVYLVHDIHDRSCSRRRRAREISPASVRKKRVSYPPSRPSRTMLNRCVPRAQVKSIETSWTFSPLRRLPSRRAPTPATALLPRYRMRSRNLFRLCKSLSHGSQPLRRKPTSASRRRAMHPAHRRVPFRTAVKRGIFPRIRRPQLSCRPRTTGIHSRRIVRTLMTSRIEE